MVSLARSLCAVVVIGSVFFRFVVECANLVSPMGITQCLHPTSVLPTAPSSVCGVARYVVCVVCAHFVFAFDVNFIDMREIVVFVLFV